MIKKFLKLFFWFLAFVLGRWLTFAQVYISEVFYAGSDEWIELFSPDWYSWEISLIWTKSSELKTNISIPAGWIIILADEGNNILDKSYIQKSWISFNFTDSNPINITLKAWDFSHSFSIDPTSFPKPNIRTSFSYIFSNWIPSIIIQTKDFFNSTENASPWKLQENTAISSYSQPLSSLSSSVSSSSESISSSISSINSSNSSSQSSWSSDSSNSSSSEQSTSWVSSSFESSVSNSSSLESSSWVISSSINSSSWDSSSISSSFSSSSVFSSEQNSSQINIWNIISITEINPTNHFYPEYIEIFANQSFSWSIYLSGAWKAQKTTDINIHQWEFYLLTDSASGFLNENIFMVPWIVLNDKFWDIKIFGESFSTSATYSWNTNYKSWWFWKTSWLLNQTPGFDNKFEKYIKPISSSLSCWIKIQNSKAFYAWDSVNLIAVLDWKEIQNSSSDTCSYFVDWKPIFWQCNPSYSTNFSAWISLVSLTISTQYGQKCQTSVYLNLPFKTNISNNIINSNSQSSQNSFQSSIMTLACYNPSIFDISQVKIKSVLPNPDWKDDHEKVVLTSSWFLNLSWYYLQAWSKKTILSWDILDNKEIVWNLWMKNSYGCAYLYNENKFIVSQFCWNNPKENEIILDSYQPLEQVPMFLWKDFGFEDGCFKFKNSEIFCDKNINIDETKYEKLKTKYDELSQKFKDYKTEQKDKYSKLNEKLKKYKTDAKEKYDKLKQKYDEYKKSQKEKYDKLNEKYKTQKQKDKEKEKYNSLNEKFKKYKSDQKEKIAKLKADAKKKYDGVVLKRKKKIEAEKKLQATNKDLRQKNSNLKALHDFDISFFNYLKKNENLGYEKNDFSLYSLGQKWIWSWIVINWIKYDIKNYWQLQQAYELGISKKQADEKLQKFKKIFE